jgi:hypothetical protein
MIQRPGEVNSTTTEVSSRFLRRIEAVRSVAASARSLASAGSSVPETFNVSSGMGASWIKVPDGDQLGRG